MRVDISRSFFYIIRMAAVKIKINGSTYNVTGIHYSHNFWYNAEPISIDLYIVENFYYTPAPPSKHKREKIWGQKPKAKHQTTSVHFVFPCTAEINKIKFKLDDKEERASFTDYFYSLLALETL